MTLNSVARRAVSEWQELVKHEFTGDLAELLEIIKKRPGLQSKLIPEFLRVIKPRKASLIFSSREAPPSKIIVDYRAAIDVKTPEDMLNDLTTECLLNKSLGLVETAILLGINRQLKTSLKDVPHLNWFSVRNQLLGLFASGSWKKSVPYANLRIQNWFPPTATARD